MSITCKPRPNKQAMVNVSVCLLYELICVLSSKLFYKLMKSSGVKSLLRLMIVMKGKKWKWWLLGIK